MLLKGGNTAHGGTRERQRQRDEARVGLDAVAEDNAQLQETVCRRVVVAGRLIVSASGGCVVCEVRVCCRCEL